MSHFQPSYGAGFTLSDEAIEGITSLVTTGVGLTAQAVKAGKAKKAAKRKDKRAPKKTVSIAPPAAPAPAPAAPPAPAPVASSVPTWAIAAGVGAAGMIGFLVWKSSQKAAPAPVAA
jgi:hypothetical protein